MHYKFFCMKHILNCIKTGHIEVSFVSIVRSMGFGRVLFQ